MNARAVNAAAGVIHAAMQTRQTAAGIAAAVDAAGMLQSPETAAAHADEVDRWITTAESWRQRYYAEAGVRWDNELPPGGEVCATCEQPVESEPCPEHNPRALMERMDEAARERWIEQQIAETGLRSMDFRNGMSMDIEPARDLVAQWVGAARAMLGDAPNYSETPIEMVVKVGESPERFAFILQRVGKLTPHEARQQAEARVTELEAQRDRRRGRLVALQNDALNMRTALSPNGEKCKVPFPLGETLTPAVEWLIARVAELERSAASAAALAPGEGCTCMPHRKFPCGHCEMDLCEDCGRCCSCTCAAEGGEPRG